MKVPAIVIALVICLGVLNAVNLTPLLGPLLYTMTPLQRYYATDYLASSWHAPEILGVPPTRQLESKAPASNRILTASVASIETKPTPEPVAVPASVPAPSNKKSAAVQVPVSVTPTASAKPKPTFVWDESQGID